MDNKTFRFWQFYKVKSLMYHFNIKLNGKYFVTVQNSGAWHSFCNISFGYFYMWHWWNILGILRVSNGSPTGSPQTYRPTRPTRLHIRNLLDRRFGTIFLYNNDSFMISILLHKQNLNLVILDERNYLKDFVIWCKDRRWYWHDKFHWSKCH